MDEADSILIEKTNTALITTGAVNDSSSDTPKSDSTNTNSTAQVDSPKNTEGEQAEVSVLHSSQTSADTSASFHKALKILSNHGTIGQSIKETILRLHEGQKNYWNPYWINSGLKLEAICTAVEKLQEGTKSLNLLQYPNSELYQALNMQRLPPITFLGRLGFYQAKSLLALKNGISTNQTKQSPVTDNAVQAKKVVLHSSVQPGATPLTDALLSALGKANSPAEGVIMDSLSI